MSTYLVDIDGELVPQDEARLEATDLGFLYGIGLFETMCARGGVVFRLQQHLDRLLGSATKLSLPISPDALPNEKRIGRLLSANDLSEARLRLTVTAGSPKPNSEVAQARVLLSAVPVQGYPDRYYREGITALVSPQVQLTSDPLTGHKTTCYWPRLCALNTAQKAGCAEALWFTEKKRLAEGSISNVFVVSGKAVKTPPLDTPVLPGITRAAVIEVCTRLRVQCEEVALTIDDLLDADEVFLTNCMMQVVPVCRVERRAIGTEKVGPITRELMQAYDALVRHEGSGSVGP